MAQCLNLQRINLCRVASQTIDMLSQEIYCPLALRRCMEKELKKLKLQN